MATQNLSPQGYNFGMDPKNNNPFWKNPEVVGQYVKYIDYRQNGNTFVIYYVDNNNEEHTVCRFTITGGQDGVTYTPHVEETENGYTLSWTNDGGLPNPETITISNGTDGQDGQDGTDGQDGVNGVTFTPSVTVDNDDVTISWTNDGDLPNPQPVTYKTTPQPTAADIGKFLKVAGTSAAPVLMFGDVEAVPAPQALRLLGSFDGQEWKPVDISAYQQASNQSYNSDSPIRDGTNVVFSQDTYGDHNIHIQVPSQTLGLLQATGGDIDFRTFDYLYDEDGSTQLGIWCRGDGWLAQYIPSAVDFRLLGELTDDIPYTKMDGTTGTLSQKNIFGIRIAEFGSRDGFAFLRFNYTGSEPSLVIKSCGYFKPQLAVAASERGYKLNRAYMLKGVTARINGDGCDPTLTLSLADFSGEITKEDLKTALPLFTIERNQSFNYQLTAQNWDDLFSEFIIYSGFSWNPTEHQTITEAGTYYLGTQREIGGRFSAPNFHPVVYSGSDPYTYPISYGLEIVITA